MSEQTDYIATELLHELKEGNARKDAQIVQLQKQYMYTIYGFLLLILVIIAGFLIYLNQYDYVSSSEYTYEATGVYSLVDSSGNVIAQDLTEEEVANIMEVLTVNGDSAENSQSSSDKDT